MQLPVEGMSTVAWTRLLYELTPLAVYSSFSSQCGSLVRAPMH